MGKAKHESDRVNNAPAFSNESNIGLFHDESDSAFLTASLAALSARGQWLVITEDSRFLRALPAERLDFIGIGLDDVPIRFYLLLERIMLVVKDMGEDVQIVVDMRWGLRSVSAAANFERWGRFAIVSPIPIGCLPSISMALRCRSRWVLYG